MFLKKWFFARAAKSTAITISVAMCAAVSLASCSTGSSTRADVDTSDMTPDQLEFLDYQVEADKVCFGFRQTMAASLEAYELHEATSRGVIKGTTKVARPSDVEAYVKDQIRHLEDQQKAVREIKLPDTSDSKTITKLWADADTVIAAVKAKPVGVNKTDPFKPIARKLKDLGFAQCFQAQRPDVETESDADSEETADTTVAA